jgi:F420-dependent oxidoreductase-like protein
MLRLPDPSLVVLVGASAAGKSAWAQEHFPAEQVVSSDHLRAVVGESESDLAASADAFAVLESIVAARIGRRLTTVIDTLGLDADRRREWRTLAARHRVHTVAVAFDVPAAECRRRNALRERRIPASILAGQLKQFARAQVELEAEGFDEIIAPEPVRVVPPAFAAAARSGRPAGARPSEPLAQAPPVGGAPRFGLHLSSFAVPGGPAALADRLTEVAVAAEAAGFASIWVMDHFRQIPQLGRPWEDMLESTAALGYLAAATRTASIGCLVNCVTYRNLGHLAKIVATLDVLSGGRAWCGLGAGWFEAEHLAYGWPFAPAAERLDLLEDALRLLPIMWGPGTPAFDGTRTAVPETMCYPRPLRSPVPLLVGGSGEKRTLRLVARYADACNLTGDTDTVRRKLDVLRSHCAEVGRDPATVEVTHLSTALVAGNAAELERETAARRPARNVARWAARVNPGTVEDHVLRVRTLQEAGVQHVIVSLDGIWDSPAIERFAEVIAAFRAGPEPTD